MVITINQMITRSVINPSHRLSEFESKITETDQWRFFTDQIVKIHWKNSQVHRFESRKKKLYHSL